MLTDEADRLLMTHAELIAITGYKQPAAQLQALQALGFWRARRAAVSGRIVLERAHYDAVKAGAVACAPVTKLDPPKFVPVFQPMAWLDQHWKTCVVGPDMDVSTYDPWVEWTDDEGLYFLFGGETGRLLYVGISADVQTRLFAHLKAQRIPFKEYAFLPLRQDVAKHVEAAHIFALEPPFNTKYQRCGWRGHDVMVRRIRRMWMKALRPC